MNNQFTIRLDDISNEKTIEAARSLNITRAALVRNAITSYLNKPNPNEDSEIVSVLKEQLAKTYEQIDFANEAKSRSDIIVMELAQQIKHQQKQLEDLTEPTTLWQKLRTVFS